MTDKLLAVFLVILWCILPSSLHANVLGHITLKDGSLLYGEIIGMNDGILRARSASSQSNSISFKWEEVTGLVTEMPITLILDNGETLEGTTASVRPGVIQLQSELMKASVPIALRSIVAINPSDQQVVPDVDPDEIVLKNGTRLTGQIVSMEKKKLKLTTSYAEDITIKWENVQELFSHKPLTIELRQQMTDSDSDRFFESRRIQVRSLADAENFPFSQIKTINVSELRYKGSLDLGGNRTSGNTNTTALNGSAQSAFWTDRHRLDLSAKFAFATADGKDTANNARGTIKYDYFLTKKLFVPFVEFLEQDQFQGLEVRSTTGVGVGYTFLDTSIHIVSGSIIPGIVYERFEETGTTTTPTMGWGLDWEYKLFSKKINIFHRQKGFRDFGGAKSTAVRWIAEQGVRLDLFENLYFRLEYDYRFNSRPEPGKKQSDEAFIWGVGYEFSN